jgi:hypothetical protein
LSELELAPTSLFSQGQSYPRRPASDALKSKGNGGGGGEDEDDDNGGGGALEKRMSENPMFKKQSKQKQGVEVMTELTNI